MAFGLEVYWVSGLNRRLMLHTMRDGMGIFVVPERLADFHKSMLFAFYGSNQKLTRQGEERLGDLMDALIAFWGRNIGIVTGGAAASWSRPTRWPASAVFCRGPTFWNHRSVHDHRRGLLPGVSVDLSPQPPEVV